MAGEEGRHSRVDEDVIALSLDEPLPQQHGQVDGAPDRPAVVGGGRQAEEVRHGAGPDQGHPEPSHQGIVGGVPWPSGMDQARADPGSGECRHPDNGLPGTRDWRGIHRHGRTGISTEGPGC